MGRVGQSRIRRFFALTAVSLGYMGRAFPLVLAMTALASFCFVKAFEGALPGNASAVDALIWAFDPSVGISLLWFVCPAIFMVALSRVWKEKERAHVIVAHGSEGKVFASYLADVLLLALAGTAVLLVTLLACGLATFGTVSNFGDSSSLMASYVKETTEGFGFSTALPVFALYGFLSLAFSGMAFYVVRVICKNTVAAFGVVAACGLPQVHGATSFVYDAAKTVGLNMPIVNPLSYLYETASVFYPSWIPGASHSLWVLALAVACLVGIGFVVTHGRDYASA